MSGAPTIPLTAAPIDPQAFARLLVVMERLAASSDLHEVLSLIIDALRDGLRADRATVFQYDGQHKELFISQAHGLAGGKGGVRFCVDGAGKGGIAGEVARARQMLNLADAYADARFNRAMDQQTGYRTRNLLTIPLMSFDGGLEGVAQVLNKRTAAGDNGTIEGFDAADESLARALASQAAVALRRAKSLEAERRKNKLEHDLKLARDIQQSAFPQSIPGVEGYDIAAASIPAEETGGDTFDLLDWGACCPDADKPGLLFTLADATGHGVGPALSVAGFRGMFRMGARLGMDVWQIAKHIDAQMSTDLPVGRFITAFIGHLNPTTGCLHYTSAGQAPLVVVRADGRLEELPANGLPVGVAPDIEPEVVEPIRLDPGDVFMLLTDGYFEAPDGKGEQFGVEGVAQVVRTARSCGMDARSILSALDVAVEQYAGDNVSQDDRTALVILRK